MGIAECVGRDSCTQQCTLLLSLHVQSAIDLPGICLAPQVQNCSNMLTKLHKEYAIAD
jgi:hypothetical protein